jgi:hypothetical protein
VPERSSWQPGDALRDWASGRSESISADNLITAQIDEDPASGAPDVDGVTYFPFLGMSSLGLGSSSLYNSYTPYQAGFNSMYLPGYTYLPLLLSLGGSRLQTYGPLSPRRIGLTPLGGGGLTPIPRSPIIVRPAPVHIAPPAVVHGVGHR